MRLLDVVVTGLRGAALDEVRPPPESVYLPPSLASRTPCDVSLSAPCFAFALECTCLVFIHVCVFLSLCCVCARV